MKKTTYAQPSDLERACQGLSAAAYECSRAAAIINAASSLTKTEAVRVMQNAVDMAKAALLLVAEETHAYAEIQNLTDLVAPTTTPSGVALDEALPASELSTRAYNSLLGGGVNTIRALCGLQLSDLLKFRSLGKKTMEEVEAYRLKLGAPFN